LTTKPDESLPDDRHENRGRDARAEDSFLVRNLTTIITTLGLVIAGGGGAKAVSSMSEKQDSTNEKLDKIVLGMQKLQDEVASGKEAAGKLDASLLSLLGRVAELERRDAADHERINEHDRRLSALERGNK